MTGVTGVTGAVGVTRATGAAGVTRVAVVGTGLIGARWAAYFLARGLDVSATDPAPYSMMETVIVLKPESQWREKLQADRVALARRTQYLEIVAQRLLPREKERLATAQMRLAEAGGPPPRLALSLGDTLAGMFAAQGALAALYRR